MFGVCPGLNRVRLFIGDAVVFSTNGEERVEDLTNFFVRLITFDLKWAPKTAYLGVRVLKVLGPRAIAEAFAPDPGMVDAMT